MADAPSDRLQFRRRRFHLDLRGGRNEPMMRHVPDLHMIHARLNPCRIQPRGGTHFDSPTPRACPDRRARIDQPEFITPVVIYSLQGPVANKGRRRHLQACWGMEYNVDVLRYPCRTRPAPCKQHGGDWERRTSAEQWVTLSTRRP